MTRRNIYAVLLLVSVAVIAMMFHRSFRSGGGLSKIPGKVVIASVSDLQAAIVNMAYVKGYFKDNGLDVDIVQHTFGKAALQTMLDGKADFAAVAETPSMYSILKGEKIYFLSSIQNTAKATGVIALKDRGIASAGDLNGKTIGIPKGTTGDYFFYLFCMVHGIKYGDLKIIDIRPENLLDALIKGQVDAVSTWQQHAAKIVKTLSDRAITFQSEGIYTATFTITAKQEYVRRNPEVVERVLAALFMAEQFMKRQPLQSQDILADYNKIDRAMVQELWAVNNFELTLDQYLVNLLENESHWAITENIVKNAEEHDFLDYVYLDGLKKIKPFAVTVIK